MRAGMGRGTSKKALNWIRRRALLFSSAVTQDASSRFVFPAGIPGG